MRFTSINSRLRLFAHALATIGLSKLVLLTAPCETWGANIGQEEGEAAMSAERT